ncbi:hypothetical protein PoB_005377600 [Plakobranchus ocellatus]|uniref:Lipase domain-containing protein n=1 Tax=Plakobranchus ocellatus TaxID=259542 RepID=A0AAV4C7F0_9GAST|nr:hypothetical protein PoB_005377600 [Plakobranchus ocellatus]
MAGLEPASEWFLQISGWVLMHGKPSCSSRSPSMSNFIKIQTYSTEPLDFIHGDKSELWKRKEIRNGILFLVHGFDQTNEAGLVTRSPPKRENPADLTMFDRSWCDEYWIRKHGSRPLCPAQRRPRVSPKSSRIMCKTYERAAETAYVINSGSHENLHMY